MATASSARVWGTIQLMFFVILSCSFAQGKVIYVDDDAAGANDGMSWANAYLCLQDALAAARPGDEIQVAEGIYKPDQHFVRGRSPRVVASGDRTDTFQLLSGVTVKGGYAGSGEPGPDARDIKLYETILSGDLNGDDGPNFAGNSENSYHVVRGNGTDETAVLDGFTITAGNANGNQPHHAGGGMLNDFGSPTVTHCTFRGNSAEYGGGIRNRDNSPTLTRCTFENNSTGGAGGGMLNDGDQGTPVVTDCIFSGNTADYGAGMNNRYGCSPVVRNCTFTRNSAQTDGGGICNYEYSSPTLTHCTFENNSAGGNGGGMLNAGDHCTPVVTDCIFSHNTANYGGGMFNVSYGYPIVRNCTFTGNSAEQGGGMNNQNSSPTLTNCTFENNSAALSGGGMYNAGDHCTPVVTDCIFSGNTCDIGGGGMNNDSYSNPKVTNCTFTGNSAEDGGGMFNFWDSSATVANCIFISNSAIRGGGIFNSTKGNPIITNCTFNGNTAIDGGGVWIDDSSPMLTNCILWDNTATSGPQLALYENSSVSINYCDLQGGLAGIDVDPSSFVTWGLGNIDSDPLFVDAANGDYHLQAGAPCIDAGDNSAIPAGVIVDLDGSPRIINGIVDMGAIEVGEGWPFAFNPFPADGAEGVVIVTTLSWLPGDTAATHDVYFGTTSPPAFIGNQAANSYDPGPLEFDTTYYWQADEVEADGTTIHKGDLWRFRTMPELAPNLIGWWKFDEGSGTIAYDSSGKGNDGTFHGDPQWVPGVFDYALEFDGSGDWLDCGKDPSFQITDGVTVAAWIKVGAQGIDHKIGGNQDDVNGGYKMSIFSNNRVEFEIRTAANSFVLNRDVSGGTEIMVNVWSHVTGVYSLKGGYIRTYVNGVLDREMSTTEVLGASPGSFKIGCEPFATGSFNFNGVIDDLRIYNRALTEAEILAAMEGRMGGANPNASRPKPADGALLSDTWVNLSWTPGAHAVSHDVYFGGNFDDVNDSTGDTFQGNQTATWFRVGSSRGYPFPPDLLAGTTYYWRIDEVNDTEPNSPWKGNVWSFMTPSETAYDPYPADGANFFIDPMVVLRWTAGFGANLHRVYFGDNFAHVNDADTSDTTGIYRGAQAATTYTPGPLGLDSLYYWRVDEVTTGRANKTHKGDVWSFTTAPQIGITDPNLLCWWMFDEAGGTTAIDFSGHNHYGTVNGATWVANGQVGGALDFGGDGDHVVDEDAENYLNGLDALTVCMWIKSDLTNTDKGFINCVRPDGSANAFNMRYDASGSTGGGERALKMVVISTGGRQELESSNDLQTTEWQHVAMTWSSGQALKFYVNGVLDSPTVNDAGVAGTLSGNVKLIIGKGRRDEGPSAGWDGMIDDVRIYNIALSDAEIYALGALSEARTIPGSGGS